MAETATETLKKTIWEELAKIFDPEIGLSITELGLIYDLKLDEANKAEITMTFTSMACPYGPQLKAEAHAAASRVEGVTDAHVEVVFTPAWNPREMASEEAKMYLGIY
jgi:metal-sulfur cluster biosynthetic enzyme